MAAPKGKRVNAHNRKNKTQDMAKKIAVLEMRSEGMSHRAIGELLGISYGTARNWELEMLDMYQMPAVNEYRKKVIAEAEFQLKRLHIMLKTPQYVVSSKGTYVLGPDGEPIQDPKYRIDIENAIMKLRDQLIRMLGANAPQQTEVTHIEVKPEDLEFMDLVNAQKAKTALAMDAFKAPTQGDSGTPA